MSLKSTFLNVVYIFVLQFELAQTKTKMLSTFFVLPKDKKVRKCKHVFKLLTIFRFVSLHSVDKFSKEQQISELNQCVLIKGLVTQTKKRFISC